MKSNKIDPEKMKASASVAVELLKVLGNRDRLILMCQLNQDEKSVGELESITGIKQPTLSQQISVLRNKKLVTSRREGKNIYYKVSDPLAFSVIEFLYGAYCGT
jgi:ArsR family transcriptional regulator